MASLTDVHRTTIGTFNDTIDPTIFHDRALDGPWTGDVHIAVKRIAQ